MATVPTFESVIFDIYKSAGLNTAQGSFTTAQKKKFTTREADFERYYESGHKILTGFIETFVAELGPYASLNVLDALMELWDCSHKLEHLVCTHDANERQVAWTLLTDFYAPTLGRQLGIWNEHSAMDPGMPGGIFWFLPEFAEDQDGNPYLKLPSVTVSEWLSDLLGSDSFYGLDDRLECESEEIALPALERNLYNWKKGKAPINPNKVDEYFANGVVFPFDGVFEVDANSSSEDLFKHALTFIAAKGLTPSELSHEIPLPEGQISELMSGSGARELESYFVGLVATRWAKPSNAKLRRVFRVAAAVDTSYRKLVDFLTPGIDPKCYDPELNKAAQLASLVKNIYNLTLDAAKGCSSEEEADAAFRVLLSRGPHWPLAKTFDPQYGIPFTAQLMTHKLALAEGSQLPDCTAWDESSIKSLIDASDALRKELQACDEETNEIWNAIRRGKLYKTVSKCENANALIGLLNDPSVPDKAQKLIFERMKELPLTGQDELMVILEQLSMHLQHRKFVEKALLQNRVESLLSDARQHQCYERFEALILHYEAMHLLSQSNLQDATQKLEEALQACSERSYGELKGTIAMHLLALGVATTKFNPNFVHLYKILGFAGLINEYEPNANGEVTATKACFEDVAVKCHDFFWERLYVPYHGAEPIKRVDKKVEQAYEELFRMVVRNDLAGMSDWLKDHKAIVTTGLRDVRGQSLPIILIHMRKDFVWTNEKAQSLGYRLEGPMVSLVNTFNEAIRLIFERYPSLVRSSDFKGQTPLMLAINDELSDIASTCIELGADVNDQDFKGRTALHTAAVTGDLATFNQLLSKGADPGLRTVDGMNVLHTAVRMGRPEMVELVLNERPHLATMEDDYGMTPILWSEEPADKMSAQMRSQFGRNPGSIADYKAVHHLLSNVV